MRIAKTVNALWLARMDTLAEPAGEPRDMLRAYVHAKLRFSREQPLASRVYAMEVVKGAPLYGEQIRQRVAPLLRKDIDVFERWIAEGRIARVNATHLLFAIWAMTQSYADFAAQMALVLNRKLTRRDFDDAEEMIVSMVLSAVELPAQVQAQEAGPRNERHGAAAGVSCQRGVRLHAPAIFSASYDILGLF